MEETTDDCFEFVVYWTIDNFSCWNGDIHDPVMTTEACPLFTKEAGTKFELYPRGVSGREEQVVVRICAIGPIDNVKGNTLSEVSFIGPDRSLICTRETNTMNARNGVLEFPPGPKFRDVVEHIKKNGTFHEDRLTLRFRFGAANGEGVSDQSYNMYSMIDSFEASVQIHLGLQKEMKKSENIHQASCYMEYPLNGDRMEKVILCTVESVTAADSVDIVFGVIEESAENKFAVRTLISLLNSEGSVLRTEENDRVFRDNEKWVISKSLTKKEVFQKGNSIVIDFKFIPSKGHKYLSSHMSMPGQVYELLPTKTSRPPAVLKEPTSINREFSKQPDGSAEVLKSDLMCLFQDQDFSDFQLKCDDVSFPVHKNILSARSPVFKTMLSSDMVEATSNQVVIDDLDPSTLGLFLTYLYTGTVEDLDCDRALKLYYATDKYQVPSLRGECVKFLDANVSISNVCDILSLADRHKDDKLTAVSHAFLLKNYTEVLRSEGWRNFMKREPLLAVETVTHFAEKRKVGFHDNDS